jgi:hypothetical protein
MFDNGILAEWHMEAASIIQLNEGAIQRYRHSGVVDCVGSMIGECEDLTPRSNPIMTLIAHKFRDGIGGKVMLLESGDHFGDCRVTQHGQSLQRLLRAGTLYIPRNKHSEGQG